MLFLINELGIVKSLTNYKTKSNSIPLKKRSEFAALLVRCGLWPGLERGRRKVWGHGGAVLWAWPRSGGRLRQVFPGAAVGGAYEQAVWRGSRRTALLIGLHRLRPANSEHQWAETDWASWVTKSHRSSSLICQKKCISHSPGKCFFLYVILVEELWNFGLKRNRREANVMYDLEFNAFLIIKSAPL